MLRRLAAAAALVLAAVTATAPPGGAAPAAWPDTIPLSNGYRPEGIASAGGHRAYVGSIPTGAVSVVDVRTGEVTPLVPGRAGRAAIGLEEAGGLLFVAGGPTGNAFVYDARTGADVAVVSLTPASTSNPPTTFINDVVVTRDAAWFTDSRSDVLWRVDRQTLTASPLLVSGIVGFNPGVNNLNGIEASPDGRTLYAIQSNTGTLYGIDAATGSATALLGGLTNGDGLLREGQTLYVVRNRNNEVAVVALRTMSVVDRITSPSFAVPTTVARIGDRLYLPNAKFGIPAADTAPYEVVNLRR